jgi:RNA polymerase sigma factor (sigma-70 family)
METPCGHPPRPKHGSYVVAMVLGTALSAFGPSPSLAAPSEGTTRALVDLSRYCTACWRNARLNPECWPDCTQEVFCRLLARVQPDAWNKVLGAEGEERREFLRAIDTVKKRVQRSRRWTAGPMEAVADRHDLRERRLREDRETVRQAAVDVLSLRQQRIVDLSFEGWPVQDIAVELGLPVERVSDEKYKAIRKLRAHLGRLEQMGC